jgi:murein DD-endopeptidase MepM/ murein hydrolase activator NlpD
MQLIFMRGPFSRANVLVVKLRHIASLIILLVILAGLFVTAGLYLAARFGENIPIIQDIVNSRQIERHLEMAESPNPLDAMAIRLAEMTAQLAQLDAISTRLMKSNGFKDHAPLKQQLGQGGMWHEDEKSLSYQEINAIMSDVEAQIERRADTLSIIDNDFQRSRVKFLSLANESPLTNTHIVSNFGMRIDPFTGRRSTHEGIDFIAPTGTPILAAAAGVVTQAKWNSDYGNMIEIEHNNKTTTRYAHASELLVKQGEIVRLGQKIALVGSTGRSTGPHLHFEVRVDGVPHDPSKFLDKNGLPRPGPASLVALKGLFSESATSALD